MRTNDSLARAGTLIAVTFALFFGSTIVLTRLFFRPAHPVSPTADQIATIRKLMNDLRDPDRMVRLAAISKLGDMGPPAERAVPDIKEALRDAFNARFNEDPLIGKSVRNALEKITGSDDLRKLWWKEMAPDAKSTATVEPGVNGDHTSATLQK